MKRLIVSGSHDEMGKQQGEKYLDDIAAFYRRFVLDGTLKREKPWYVPLKVFERKYLKGVIERFVPILEVIDGASERFGGIASGAKIHLGALALLHSIEVKGATFHRDIPMGTTSVYIFPVKSKSEEPIFLYNFYSLETLEKNVILRVSHPQGGISSVEITFDFMAGSFVGLNERGILVAINPVFTQEGEGSGPLLTTVVQRVLESCENIECALSQLAEFDYPYAANVLVAGDSNVYVMEISISRKKLLKPNGRYVILTNHFLSEEMTPLNLGEDVLYQKSSFHALQGKSIMRSSRERYERAEELLMRKEKLTVEDAVTLLKDHGKDFIPSYSTICAHAEGFGTVFSTVLLPTQGTVLYFSGKPCFSKYKEFKFRG